MFWSTRPLPHAVSVLVVPPVEEPLTIDEAKLRAGLDWVDGDPRDRQMAGYIAAARMQVEQRTGVAILQQTRDVYYDYLELPVTLPMLCRPLQTVLSIKVIDTAGVSNLIDPASYVVDVASGRIGPAPNVAWPYVTDVREFQPWVIRVVAGWASAALVPPLLLQAIGMLTAHYATAGRDLATIGTIVAETPQGFEDVIASYVPVEVF